MSKRPNADTILAAYDRIFKAFDDVLSGPVSRTKLKECLADIAESYRTYRFNSDDYWMSRAQVERSLRSVRHHLQQAKVAMARPAILHHLDNNHPEKYRQCSVKDELSNALSAADWALFNLNKDYEQANKTRKRQRRTRTATRDQHLIPRLTRMLIDHFGFKLDGESEETKTAEKIIRVILREWPVITPSTEARSYERIGRKPLRRIMRAVAEKHAPLDDDA